MLNKGEKLTFEFNDDNHVWFNGRQFISLTRVGEMLKEREELVHKQYRTDISILEKFRALGYEPAALELMIEFWKENHPNEKPIKFEVEFVHTGGPYGDCTDNYDVKVPIGATVREFISHIVDERSVKVGEWGDITVYPFVADRRLRLDSAVYSCTFNRGESKSLDRLTPDIADRKIKEVRANGGWSSMGYSVYI